MPDDLTTDGRPRDQPDARGEARLRQLGIAGGIHLANLTLALTDLRAAPADTPATAARWALLGPRNVGGAVRCLAQDPREPGTWYAGSAQGGLWRTTDDGYRWSALDDSSSLPDRVPPGIPVTAVAVTDSNPTIVYVGTGERFDYLSGVGIYRFRPATGAFERLAGPAVFAPTGGVPPGSADHYMRIVVDPAEPRRFWTATEQGLFRCEPTTSGGWDFHLESVITPGRRVVDCLLLPDPAAPGTRRILLATVWDQLAIATDPGCHTGIYRAVHDTTAHTTSAWAKVWPASGTAPQVGRIGLGAPQRVPGAPQSRRVYAAMEDQGLMGASHPSHLARVLLSNDLGASFVDRGSAAAQPPIPRGYESIDGVARYALSIAVDPFDDHRLVVGSVNAYMSVDSGLTWSTILDWMDYGTGDRAKHADQHALAFDRRDHRAIWSANDGGVSMTRDRGLTWRKRSYGMVGAQLTDITTHPRHPFILGGGMQDNGTYVSFGGPSWYFLNGGDGGQLAFHPTNPRLFYATSQQGPVRVTLAPPPVPLYQATLPDLPPPGNAIAPRIETTMSLPGGSETAPFIGILVGHDVTANQLLIGRKNGVFYSNDGAGVTRLDTPGLSASESISAVAFAGDPAQVWVGTNQGNVYWTDSTPPTSAPLQARPLPGLLRAQIFAIAVHPGHDRLVAVATAVGVHLSHDRGQHWIHLGGPLGPGGMPRGGSFSLAFHPTDQRTLFAGTLVGVVVARDLPAPPAVGSEADLTPGGGPPPVVHWAAFSDGLPNVEVTDLHVSPVTGTLRCATFGRGVYECTLRGTTPAAFVIPPVFLYIRDRVVDDGRRYDAANDLLSDPRVPAPAVEPTDFDRTRSFDIRVDAPAFERRRTGPLGFGEKLDGAELDELVVSEDLVVGHENIVHVQVHNRGTDDAVGVEVHLYYAEVLAGGTVPDVDFGTLHFPGAPDAGSAWQRAEAMATADIRSGHPVVALFRWIPPLRMRRSIALMAVARHASDAPALPATGTRAIATLTRDVRHASVRVVPIRRDILYIRDGLDDDGLRGSVAWGGRSPDIIVLPAALPTPDDPAGPLGDLADPRLDATVRAGDSTVYVRVSNRTRLPVSARVRLFRVPLGAPAPESGWTAIGGPVDVADIPPVPAPGRSPAEPPSWRTAAFTWTGVTDPTPDRSFALLAIASVMDGGTELDPFPDTTSATDVAAFWQLVAVGATASRVALRTVRFEPPTAPPPTP
jgi:hypothetical protein